MESTMVAPTLTQLQDNDPATRSLALKTLAASTEPDLVTEAAARLLADEDAGVRDQAARLLVEIGGAETAASVASRIASENITERNLAGEVLVQMGQCAVDAIVPAVENAVADMRKFAIDLLAQLPAQAYTDRIALRLADEDCNVRLAAIDALGALEAYAYADALHALYFWEPITRPSVVTALSAFSRAADLDILVHALSDEDPVVQFGAIKALARHNAPQAHAILIDKVEAVSPTARSVLLKALVERQQHAPGSTLPPHFKDYLLAMLDDAEPSYQCAAAKGLRSFLDDETVTALLVRAGQHEMLDVEIFNTLSRYPDVLLHIVAACEAEALPAAVAGSFTLGLLSRGAADEATYAKGGQFFSNHFKALETDVKLAVLHLYNRLRHPAAQAIVAAALNDPDSTIRTFAADAARRCSATHHDASAESL